MGYRVNKGFITQKAGESIVLFDAEKSLLYTLNETASYIFSGIKRGWSEEKIQEKLLEKFDIDEKHANEDIHECFADLIKKEIIVVKD